MQKWYLRGREKSKGQFQSQRTSDRLLCVGLMMRITEHQAMHTLKSQTKCIAVGLW